LAVGLALLSLAIGLAMLRAPMSVAGTNKVAGQPEELLTGTSRSASYCQAHETLPRGSTAIRIWLDAIYGPRVSVLVTSDGRMIASGQRGAGWTGGSVTVPVRPLSQTVSGVVVCASFRLRDETIVVQGNTAPAASSAYDGGEAIGGRMWIEYLKPGELSWASLIPTVVRHMGFGRAAAGSWVVFLALALVACIAILTARLVSRELP
jgi:hypothetical protein